MVILNLRTDTVDKTIHNRMSVIFADSQFELYWKVLTDFLISSKTNIDHFNENRPAIWQPKNTIIIAKLRSINDSADSTN